MSQNPNHVIFQTRETAQQHFTTIGRGEVVEFSGPASRFDFLYFEAIVMAPDGSLTLWNHDRSHGGGGWMMIDLGESYTTRAERLRNSRMSRTNPTATYAGD